MAALVGGADAAEPGLESGIVGPQTLGSAIADTVFTPLPNGRCRVADSRVIGSPLPGGVTRNIDVEDTPSYASQGGGGSSAGDGSFNCGIPNFVTALAVSVTVLTVGHEGFFKIFENGQPYTTGNTLYYMANVSSANDVIVKSCQICGYELAIYSNTSVHYVIDVLGYFMAPQATALQCQDTSNSITSVPAGAMMNVVAPACPTGYTQTATNCESGSWAMPFVFTHGGACSAQNNGAASAELRASRTCCRVPGR